MVDWLPVKLNLNVDVKPSKEKIDKIVEALLTIISPYTERKGLIGDVYKHQRSVLALEFKKAIEKIKEEDKKFEMPPPKFMLEFANKASREDLESQLIDTWANLLREAGTNYSPNLLPFINIISQLGSVEAKMLCQFMKVYTEPMEHLSPETKKLFLSNNYTMTNPSLVLPWMDLRTKFFRLTQLKGEEEESKSFDKIYDFVKNSIKGPVLYFFQYDDFRENSQGNSRYKFINENDKKSIDILIHLNLLTSHSVLPPFDIPQANFKFEIITPSSFGVQFYLACLGE